MLPDLFIADLHLSPAREDVTQAFLRFLASEATAAGRLFVLGDLFDYWIGDDDGDRPLHAMVLAALRRLSDRGCSIRLMHGNRDFLLGERFAGMAGAELVADPTVVDVNGVRTLLAHGDAYCTHDAQYQAFRATVRAAAWRRTFLERPLAERRRIAEDLRARSEETKRIKPPEAMDVYPAAIAAALRETACARMIHGHTHRPARHALELDGLARERWVLSDWGPGRSSYLCCDEAGCRRVPVA